MQLKQGQEAGARKREIDEIPEKSLKDAGYRAEHVSKTKDTDRAYWKEARVSLLILLITLISGSGTPTASFFRRSTARMIPRNMLFSIGARCIIFADVWCRSSVTLKASGTHDGNCHVKDNTSKGRPTVVQRGALKRASLLVNHSSESLDCRNRLAEEIVPRTVL